MTFKLSRKHWPRSVSLRNPATGDIPLAFEALQGAAALYVCGDPLILRNRVSHQHLGAGRAIAHGPQPSGAGRSGRPDVLGTNLLDLFRRSADYVNKILRGMNPADIRSNNTKFDLVGI